MRSRHVLLAFLLASLVTAVPSTVFAQTETGRIAGTVTDPSGLVVPGATITLTSTTSGGVRTTVSDSVGRYLIANVPAGTYTLKVELSGFAPQTQNVTVSVGSAVSVDSKLRVAGAAESVSVTAEAPVVNISNAEVSTIVHQEQIRDLPLLTRNPYDLVALSGNVQDQPREQKDNGATRGTGFTLNGARASGTNILLDGSANNNEFDTTVGQQVPLDSVQEFSVVTNNFSAQYGRASGGIVNVITKSGTNSFTGTAYEFFRSDSLASNSPDNVANNIPKGKFKRNQPGYSLGGPIVKDKVLFFSSLEYIGVSSNDTQISWVPTPQFLAASSAATRAYFAAYDKGVQINGPILTRDQVSAIVGSGSGAFNSLPAGTPIFGRSDRSVPIDAGGGDPQKDYQTVNKVDFNASTNTQFNVRYAYQHRTLDAGTNSSNPYPGFDTGYVYRRHNILGSLTHVYSPRLTSQTKVTFTRFLEQQPVNGPPTPRLMMNPSGAIRLQGYRIAFPGYLPWNPGNDIPFGGPQQLTQVYHDQTWLKGVHDFRFGGSYVHINDNRTFSAYSNAVEALNTSSTSLTSLNNFVTGNILRFQAAINPNGYPGGTFVTPVQQPSFTSHNRYDEFGLYAQDNWSIKSRVTLNLGVRYEYYGPQKKSDPKYDSNFYYADPSVSVSTSTPQQIIDAVRGGTVFPSNLSPVGSLWAPDRKDFAPRIGFAWDVNGDGRTAIRGGYGMAYERNFGNVTYNVLFNPPQYLVATIDSPTDLASQPVYVDDGGPFAGVAGVTKKIPAGSLRHIDQNIKTAYTHQYGASLEKQFGGGWAGGIEYNGSSGRRLYDLADVNKRGAALIYEGIGTSTARPNPAYAAFNSRGNRGRSQYHGVTFSLDSRGIGNTGLSLTSRYTLSRTKDNLSTTFSDGSNGNYNLGYLDAFNPMLDYGYAEHDVRHRLSVSGVWNLPFLNNGSGAMRTALGGWQVNTIFTARSGYPFSIYDCTNQGNGVCMRAVDPGNINKNASGTAATGNPNEFNLLDLTPLLGSAGSYINPLTGNTNYGPYPSNMTARNAFRGPGKWNIDFGLNKRFRFRTNNAVQFRFEAFNIFNHANMYVHSDNTDISGTTMVTGYREDNRRMQLGVKFEF
jgi:outer membrane receptor protein involved in Fe transport